MKEGVLSRMFLISFVIILLVACAPAGDTLPTLAQLPAEAPSGSEEALPTVDEVSVRPTLPPEWTATPSPTPSPTLTETPTVTVTPSATITDTPSPTFTPEPTQPLQSRPLTDLILAAAQATVLPADFVVPAYQGIEVALNTPFPTAVIQPLGVPGIGSTPTIAPPPVTQVCQFLPAGGFGVVFTNNPDVSTRLGCPLGNPPDVLSRPGAAQTFQQGIMIWIDGEIYVLNSTTRAFQRYADTFVSGADPETSGETPPPGLVAPVRGFLKVWSQNPAVRDALGWAVAPEAGAQASLQRFANGLMIWLPVRNDILVLVTSDGLSGTWRSFSGSF